MHIQVGWCVGGHTRMDRVQSNTLVNMWAVTRKLRAREDRVRGIVVVDLKKEREEKRRRRKKGKEKKRKRRKKGERNGKEKKKCETPMQRRPYTICSV